MAILYYDGMPTPKKLIALSFGMIAVFVIALLIPRDKNKRPAHPLGDQMASVVTVPGTPDICAYWQPWHDALAPHPPSQIMEDIANRARLRAARTEEFKKWANARPRVPEHICALGQRVDGVFTMDLKSPDGPCQPGSDPLDYAIRMRVDPGDTHRVNFFHLEIMTDTLSANRLKQLLAQQSELLERGYGGWQAAFPEFGNRGKSGIAITHAISESRSGPALNASVGWDPQRFWQNLPLLATWVLNLGGLVTVETDIIRDGLLLARMATSTKALRSDVHLPFINDGVTLLPDEDFALVVSHKVTIDYKGLVIAVDGLRFAGDVTHQENELHYKGRFTGISGVEVTGEYKGLSALGITDMIKKLIKDKVNEEANVLATGNSGKGWVIEASLAPSASDPTKSIATLMMEVEAQVHITELIRYESDARAGEVLPGRGESHEFGTHVDSVLGALLRDTKRFACLPQPQ